DPDEPAPADMSGGGRGNGVHRRFQLIKKHCTRTRSSAISCGRVRSFIRRILRMLTLASAIGAMMVGILWVRSYEEGDTVEYMLRNGESEGAVWSSRGRIVVLVSHQF